MKKIGLILFAFFLVGSAVFAQVEPIKFNKYGNNIFGFRPDGTTKIMLGVFADDEDKAETNINILEYKQGVNEWRIDNVGDDYYTISTHTGLYLTVQGSATEHAQLMIDQPKRNDSQIWRIVPANKGTFYILSKINEQLLVTVVGPFVYLEKLETDNNKFTQTWSIKGM